MSRPIQVKPADSESRTGKLFSPLDDRSLPIPKVRSETRTSLRLRSKANALFLFFISITDSGHCSCEWEIHPGSVYIYLSSVLNGSDWWLCCCWTRLLPLSLFFKQILAKFIWCRAGLSFVRCAFSLLLSVSLLFHHFQSFNRQCSSREEEWELTRERGKKLTSPEQKKKVAERERKRKNEGDYFFRPREKTQRQKKKKTTTTKNFSSFSFRQTHIFISIPSFERLLTIDDGRECIFLAFSLIGRGYCCCCSSESNRRLR